jgi:hypothetical protein
LYGTFFDLTAAFSAEFKTAFTRLTRIGDSGFRDFRLPFVAPGRGDGARTSMSRWRISLGRFSFSGRLS